MEALPRGAVALAGCFLGDPAAARHEAQHEEAVLRPDSPIFEVYFEEATIATEKALDVLLPDVVAKVSYVDV